MSHDPIPGSEPVSRKILYTASTYSHIKRFHLPYLRELHRLGWEVHIACAGAPPEAPYADKSIDLPFVKRMSAPDNFKATRQLRELIQVEDYDLINTHTSLAAFFTRLAVKDMESRPRLINVVHGYLFDDATPFVKHHLLLNAERFTAPKTDLVLTMNRYDYDTARKYHLGREVEMIPGIGVDFAALDEDWGRGQIGGDSISREGLGIPQDAFVLIYPAEFSARKSQEVLIKAIALLPEDTVLLLCGDGSELDKCQALVRELQLDKRVLFPGRVEHMAAWYALSDAAVTASRSEGLPFNVMEAMHCNLPVVASRVKGHTDLIDDGLTGLLYDYGNAEQCARQIRRLINEPPLRAALSTNARQSVSPYALNQVLDKVLTAYGVAPVPAGALH